MKLFCSIITFCMLSFGLSACGSSNAEDVIEPPTGEESSNEHESEQDSTKTEIEG